MATSPKRSGAAKKAAATRKRNAAKRSAAAKKAARTRKRRANPAPKRKRAARRSNPAPAKRKRRRNPGAGRFAFGRVVKETGVLALVAAAVLAIGNKLGNYAKEGQPSIAQKVGPVFPVAFDLAALWVITKYANKLGVSKYKGKIQTVLGTMAALDTIRLAAYAAQHDWSLDPAKVKALPADSWVSYVQPLPAPDRAPALRGYLRGAASHSAPGLPPGTVALNYDARTGSYSTLGVSR